MYDDIRLHVARSYTSSADSPFSLMSSFTLFNHLLLGLPLFLLPVISLPWPSFLRSVPLSSHHIPIPLQPSFLDFLCDFPQPGDLYSVLVLFSECGIINLVEKQNCTVHNGTWYNHTCYVVTDGGDHDKYSVNLTSEYMMRSVLASRKSPSDEYFQYVILITLSVCHFYYTSSSPRAFTIIWGRRNGFEYH